MAVLHMNDPLAQPGDYIDEFDRKADKIIRGDREGAERRWRNTARTRPRTTIYEHPERICSGIYAIKHIWPTINDRTNIMMELDNRKTDLDKYECTLAIFYESVKFPVDPADSAKMHEVL